MALAVRESLQSDSLIIPLVSVLIGSAIGSYIKIEERFESLGNYLHKKYESDDSDKSIFISSFLRFPMPTAARSLPLCSREEFAPPRRRDPGRGI